MSDPVVRARCDPELKRRVLALAKLWKMKEADILRWALEDYLRHHEAETTPPFLRAPEKSTTRYPDLQDQVDVIAEPRPPKKNNTTR